MHVCMYVPPTPFTNITDRKTHFGIGMNVRGITRRSGNAIDRQCLGIAFCGITRKIWSGVVYRRPPERTTGTDKGERGRQAE